MPYLPVSYMVCQPSNPRPQTLKLKLPTKIDGKHAKRPCKKHAEAVGHTETSTERSMSPSKNKAYEAELLHLHPVPALPSGNVDRTPGSCHLAVPQTKLRTWPSPLIAAKTSLVGSKCYKSAGVRL